MIIALFIVLSGAHAFDWQGHRGARGLYPENTIGAMKVALSYPLVTTLELDVVISQDNQVVVSHEPWMSEDICTGAVGKGLNIYQLPYKSIATYDCGSKPHPRFPRQKKIRETKPLLRDLLAEFKEKNFNIEIKSTPEDEKAGFQPPIEPFTDQVIAAIQSVVSLDRVHIQSFDWRVLRYLHKRYPAVKTVALTDKPSVGLSSIREELGFTPTVFSPYYKFLTAKAVREYRKASMKVIPWTINDVTDMRKAVEMGVDGIITDYPDLIFPVVR